METELLTIQEVAKRTGLSIDTLRYYELIGLIEPVGRAQSGHRRYTQHDLDQRVSCLMQSPCLLHFAT